MGLTGIIDFFNIQVKRFSVWDVKLAQIAAATFAMFVFSFWPDVIKEGRWLWFILWLVAAIKPSWKIYKREPKKEAEYEKKPKRKAKKRKGSKKARV